MNRSEREIDENICQACGLSLGMLVNISQLQVSVLVSLVEW